MLWSSYRRSAVRRNDFKRMTIRRVHFICSSSSTIVHTGRNLLASSFLSSRQSRDANIPAITHICRSINSFKYRCCSVGTRSYAIFSCQQFLSKAHIKTGLCFSNGGQCRPFFSIFLQVIILRYGDGGEDAEDHQYGNDFDEGKTLLPYVFTHVLPPIPSSNSRGCVIRQRGRRSCRFRIYT